jgi:hypothetical protein
MKSSYGLSGDELAALTELHRKARMNRQGDLMEFIEEGLTDINYHTFAASCMMENIKRPS